MIGKKGRKNEKKNNGQMEEEMIQALTKEEMYLNI